MTMFPIVHERELFGDPPPKQVERFNAFKHWYGTAYPQAQLKHSTTASPIDIWQEEK